MSSRISLLVRTLVTVTAGCILLLVGLSQATAVKGETGAGDRNAQGDAGDQGAIIQATERISIPFGFHAALPLMDNGAAIVASGEGACAAGEAITIAFTVTQPINGASISGLWSGTCTGERQTWTNRPAATPSPNFIDGAAEACAFAETSADDVTDTQSWCDDVLLTSQRSFLPDVRSP